MSRPTPASEIADLIDLCAAAGRVILDSRDGSVGAKRDGSPVSDADRRSDDLIRAKLTSISSAPVVSEESEIGAFDAQGTFWLVDPLDGTREFIKGSPEFTVNIARVDRGEVICGAVHAPALGLTYWGARGRGAFKLGAAGEIPIHVASPPPTLRVAVSRDHLSPMDRRLIERLGRARTMPMGSSLKFCLVAEGEADLYPRHGRTMEWDTAAAQCVIEQAGGVVIDFEGRPLRYGKPGFANPSFLACADAALIGAHLTNA